MRHNFLRAVSLLLILKANCLWAIPQLQLDVVGGTYDPTTQTTIANSPTFALRALSQDLTSTITTVDTQGQKTTTTTTSNTFYISAAIEPMLPNAPLPDIGTLTINGTPYSATLNASAWQWGTPPVDTAFPDIPTHGEFPTYYLELAFVFDSLHTVAAYNVQDDTSAPGSLYYQDFSIDVTGLNPAYVVHFDLYDEIVKQIVEKKKGDTTTNYDLSRNFAPFSHDAESGHNVPEGGLTLLLLGLGLTGLAALQWKSRRQAKRVVERV